MAERPALEVIREFHLAFERGDFDSMLELLAPGATWHARPGQPGVCDSREEILDRLRELAERVPPLDSLELLDVDGDVLVGLPTEEPWEEPSLYQRVRVEDGRIVLIQDHGTREAALTG